MILYCCECDKETEHKKVVDEVLGNALECLICKTVWEAEDNLENNDALSLDNKLN